MRILLRVEPEYERKVPPLQGRHNFPRLRFGGGQLIRVSLAPRNKSGIGPSTPKDVTG